MKKNYYLLLALLLSFIAIGQSLDQSNLSTNGITSGVKTTDVAGQSFKAGKTGNLNQITLKVGNVNGLFIPGNFQLRIFEGNGYTGTVLNTTVVTINTTTTGVFEELAIPLSSNVAVISGNTYTIDFRALDSAIINFFLTFNGYANGGYYFSNGNDGLYNTYDMWFKTFVDAPATHLNFDGINDRVELPNESLYDFSTQMTVELWMNSNVTPEQWDPLVTKGDNSWRLHLNDNGTVDFTCSGVASVGAISTTVVTDGTWHHVAGVFDGTKVKIYIDGVLENQVAASGTIYNSTFPVYIGNNSDYTARYYTGNIDEVRIWNVARTAEQIKSAKNCELQASETGLISYYKFNQGNATANNTGILTLTDATANANNGILSNFTSIGTTSNWLSGSAVTTGSIIPSVPTVTSPVILAQGATASALTAITGTNGTGVVWYSTATAGVGSLTAPTPSTASIGNTSYYVASKNANGCESARTEILVKVMEQATHLNFDGINNRVELPNESLYDFSTQMTVELWMNSNVTPKQWDPLITKGDDSWRLHLNDNGTVDFTCSGAAAVGAVSTTVVTDGSWHHVAGVFDGTNVKIYIDGVLENQIAAYGTMYNSSFPIYNSSFPVYIGNNSDYTTRFYTGNIDEVRIWNVARTAAEISGSKNCELQGSETGLVSYYKFNQATAAGNNAGFSTLIDATSNANNGILSNFALTGTTSNWLTGSVVTSGISCAVLNTTAFDGNTSVKLYPNPTKNSITIEVDDLSNSKLQVLDISGKVLMNKSLDNNSNSINISQFPIGMYLFKVSSNKGTTISKVVKN